MNVLSMLLPVQHAEATTIQCGPDEGMELCEDPEILTRCPMAKTKKYQTRLKSCELPVSFYHSRSALQCTYMRCSLHRESSCHSIG
ncbi:hypothetical protein BDZ91DRAFT_368248 [Kalaharituber pfeilii]|nr:hypothetical protein BDZ91DRAFT_368248 [Kalaharituber pfeilii]